MQKSYTKMKMKITHIYKTTSLDQWMSPWVMQHYPFVWRFRDAVVSAQLLLLPFSSSSKMTVDATSREQHAQCHPSTFCNCRKNQAEQAHDNAVNDFPRAHPISLPTGMLYAQQVVLQGQTIATTNRTFQVFSNLNVAFINATLFIQRH